MIRCNVKQLSPEWIALRVGRPTASNFHRIVDDAGRIRQARAKGAGWSEGVKTFLYELCVERFFGQPVDARATQFMQRGLAIEDEGKRAYEFDRGVVLEEVGFIMTDDKQCGCSPDALIGLDGGYEGKTLSPVNHARAAFETNHDHDIQMQGCMWIAERAWWDVYFYNPAFPAIDLRLNRDDEFIGNLAASIADFCDRLDAMESDLTGRGWKKCVPQTIPWDEFAALSEQLASA